MGDERGLCAHARRSSRSFTAGVTAANNYDVKGRLHGLLRRRYEGNVVSAFLSSTIFGNLREHAAAFHVKHGRASGETPRGKCEYRNAELQDP
jgi:hypothetical protein